MGVDSLKTILQQQQDDAMLDLIGLCRVWRVAQSIIKGVRIKAWGPRTQFLPDSIGPLQDMCSSLATMLDTR